MGRLTILIQRICQNYFRNKFHKQISQISQTWVKSKCLKTLVAIHQNNRLPKGMMAILKEMVLLHIEATRGEIQIFKTHLCFGWHEFAMKTISFKIGIIPLGRWLFWCMATWVLRNYDFTHILWNLCIFFVKFVPEIILKGSFSQYGQSTHIR